jgi:hypothetical protein
MHGVFLPESEVDRQDDGHHNGALGFSQTMYLSTQFSDGSIGIE